MNVSIMAYSIAINHYHIMFYLPKGKRMDNIKKSLRGGISFLYKKRFSVTYPEMRQSRKIYRVWDEDASIKIKGYIIGNLLKHKEVGTFNDLRENKFSSYWYYADKYGDNEAKELVYQVIDADEDSWGEVNINKLRNIQAKKT